MLNQMTQQQQEDYLNDFIDALIVECKPAPPTSMDQDFAAMMETIRGVKRLRSEKELLADLETDGEEIITAKAVDEEKQKPFRRKLWVSGAAVAATLFLAFGIFSQIDRMNPAMEEAQEAPAMLRSAEVAEDTEMPAEAAPEAAAGEAPEIAASEAPEIAASEVAPDAVEDESPGVMGAMEAPVEGEDSIAMFGVQEVMPNVGVAIVVKQIDRSYLEMNLIDVPAHYQSFRLTEELKNTLNENSVEQGALYSVSFNVEEGEMPVLTMIEPLEEVVLEARYLGRADSNFAEFMINSKVQVIALSESVKSIIEKVDADREPGPEGVLMVITIKGSDFSTNGIVTQALSK